VPAGTRDHDGRQQVAAGQVCDAHVREPVDQLAIGVERADVRRPQQADRGVDLATAVVVRDTTSAASSLANRVT
jgi:hypothetical protein